MSLVGELRIEISVEVAILQFRHVCKLFPVVKLHSKKNTNIPISWSTFTVLMSIHPSILDFTVSLKKIYLHKQQLKSHYVYVDSLLVIRMKPGQWKKKCGK